MTDTNIEQRLSRLENLVEIAYWNQPLHSLDSHNVADCVIYSVCTHFSVTGGTLLGTAGVKSKSGRRKYSLTVEEMNLAIARHYLLMLLIKCCQKTYFSLNTYDWITKNKFVEASTTLYQLDQSASSHPDRNLWLALQDRVRACAESN